MKKLKKSFLGTRIRKLENIPVSWGLKAEWSSHALQLDARLCQLRDVGKQLSSLLSFTRSAASSATSNSREKEDSQSPDRIFSADFSHNELSSLTYSDLGTFEELRSLSASFNQIKAFPGIASCPHLTYLCLSYNGIDKLPVTALAELKKLTHLDVRSNLIRDISDLQLVSNLRNLNISYNLLATLDGIQSLPSLEELKSQHNRLESVAALSACFALKRLDLSGNKLRSSAHVIDVLRHLSTLQELDIGRNEEVEKFLRKSSGVTLLDGKVITRGDLNSFSTSGEEDLKTELKLRAQKSMESAQARLEQSRAEQLHFMHTKIRCFTAEMDDERQKLVEDFISWSSYVDGLTPEEVRVLARKQMDGSDETSNSGALKQPSRLPGDTLLVLAEVARVLSNDKHS